MKQSTNPSVNAIVQVQCQLTADSAFGFGVRERRRDYEHLILRVLAADEINVVVEPIHGSISSKPTKPILLRRADFTFHEVGRPIMQALGIVDAQPLGLAPTT